MKVLTIIGTDLSKKTIDVYCSATESHLCIENNLKGFKKMLRWLKAMKVNVLEIMVVMEHTGLYGYLFEEFLHSAEIPFAKVNALQIKRSSGLVRGKTDKIDARRICEYGKQFFHKLERCQQTAPAMKDLRLLHSTRDRLVKQKVALECSIKEYRNIGLSASCQAMKSQLTILRALKKEIKALEEEIRKTIKANEELDRTVTLLKSVKGVGDVLAVATVIKTDNFRRFPTARKYACFCGTAPFEHLSGSSIKGRTRVSHLADKSMKTYLDLAAKSAIVHDPELRSFYLRKTEAGKPKMSTINIVRNKIIYRMFAVIKRGTPFQELAA